MNEQKKEPKWLLCYNFMSLLNIPETLEDFGPLKNYWEGSYIGEKYITQVKSEFYGKRNNWTYSMLQRINKKAIFKKLIYENNEKQTTSLARYGTTMRLQNDLLAKRPIQCYYRKDTKKFIVCLDETPKTISYVKIH